MIRGRWSHSPHVDLKEAHKVVLKLPKSYRRFRCVIDGELRRWSARRRSRSIRRIEGICAEGLGAGESSLGRGNARKHPD